MNSARSRTRPVSQSVLLLRSGACRRAHTRAGTEQVKHAFAVERVLVEIKVGDGAATDRPLRNALPIDRMAYTRVWVGGAFGSVRSTAQTVTPLEQCTRAHRSLAVCLRKRCVTPHIPCNLKCSPPATLTAPDESSLQADANACWRLLSV